MVVVMDNDYPEALQIEVTNRCNFNCQICIRRVWNAELRDLNLDLYKKIAKSMFQHLKRLILYGFGEPLLNPNFIKILKIARENLPKDSEIIVSTNGSMLNSNLSEKIVNIGVNNISFSIETTDAIKLRRIREGSEPTTILNNFRHIARIKRLRGNSFKLGIEAVIMRSNFNDLPNLIEEAAGEDVDYLLVSHLVPYTENMFHESVYVTMSGKSLEIIKPVLNYGRKIILDAFYETEIYHAGVKSRVSRIIDELWAKAEKSGYSINLPLLFESIDKITMGKEVERSFNLSRKKAREYDIDLKLPNLYPDAKDRMCPYVEKKTAFVRSDGMLTPCLEFAYKHPVYINMHIKNVNPIIFGDLRNEDITTVWRKEKYVVFREVRRRISDNISWCGDCPYSTFKCFFTETNYMDCYMNEPGCSECLYSVNLAQCNI
ncbi:MAG: radical SAM protein [Candidatus Bathyarchaeia archaeon]